MVFDLRQKFRKITNESITNILVCTKKETHKFDNLSSYFAFVDSSFAHKSPSSCFFSEHITTDIKGVFLFQFPCVLLSVKCGVSSSSTKISNRQQATFGGMMSWKDYRARCARNMSTNPEFHTHAHSKLDLQQCILLHWGDLFLTSSPQPLRIHKLFKRAFAK